MSKWEFLKINPSHLRDLKPLRIQAILNFGAGLILRRRLKDSRIRALSAMHAVGRFTTHMAEALAVPMAALRADTQKEESHEKAKAETLDECAHGRACSRYS